MKKHLGILSLFFLCSCVSLHTPSPHFAPSITKKKQLEGEAAIGLKSANVSFAYSPLNHLTIMGNVQNLPFKNGSSRFQRSCEVAIGAYGSRKKVIYGLNMGYGMGAYNWDYWHFNDPTAYLLYTQGNFQKIMIQAFLAFTDDSDDPHWVTGISLKENFYWDQYTSLRYTTEQNKDFAGMERNMSFEPCIFTRNFFNKCFYLNLQAGMNISYDRSMFWPMQYVFARIGLGLKL
jgi:hypothetical protein